jgi:hypothetical protein
VSAISIEDCSFDIQKIENPDINGEQYQRGTLYEYELRQYVLDKWDHTCAYCGAKGIPLQVEHIIAKRNGGKNTPDNLAVSCHDCNERKLKTFDIHGYKDINIFLDTDRKARKRQATFMKLYKGKRSYRDAAAVNTLRKVIKSRLYELGLPVETGSGGLTKYNRSKRNLPKEHWIDAACVGWSTPETLGTGDVTVLEAHSRGQGSRQWTDVYGLSCLGEKQESGVVKMPGYPRSAPRVKEVMGFRSGDIVRADIPTGKYKGSHIGRINVRANGAFRLIKTDGQQIAVNVKYCTKIQGNDGYKYSKHIEYVRDLT